MGENPCQLFNWQGLKSRIYNDLQKKNSKRININNCIINLQLINGQMNWIDISPNSKYKRPISTWRNVENFWPKRNANQYDTDIASYPTYKFYHPEYIHKRIVNFSTGFPVRKKKLGWNIVCFRNSGNI
jgi:hypothetical protein